MKKRIIKLAYFATLNELLEDISIVFQCVLVSQKERELDLMYALMEEYNTTCKYEVFLLSQKYQN